MFKKQNSQNVGYSDEILMESPYSSCKGCPVKKMYCNKTVYYGIFYITGPSPTMFQILFGYTCMYI